MTLPSQRSPSVTIEGALKVKVGGQEYAQWDAGHLGFTITVEGGRIVLRRDGEEWAAFSLAQAMADLAARPVVCSCKYEEYRRRARKGQSPYGVRTVYNPECRMHSAAGVLRRAE